MDRPLAADPLLWSLGATRTVWAWALHRFRREPRECMGPTFRQGIVWAVTARRIELCNRETHMRWSLGAGVAVALAAARGAGARRRLGQSGGGGIGADRADDDGAAGGRRSPLHRPAERPGQDPDARTARSWKSRSSISPTGSPRSGRSSTRRACSGSRSTRTSPTTASSTSPTASRPTGRAISTSTSGGRTPT